MGRGAPRRAGPANSPNRCKAAQKEAEKNGILGHGLHQPLDTLFDGVFEEMPWHLREQQAQMMAEEAASGRPWARKK